MKRSVLLIVVAAAALALGQRTPPPSAPPPVPRGLVPILWPPDNPYTPAKAELGRLLYFDPRLSADGTVSCASCHDPRHAFTDGQPVSSGVKGQKGGRSAPTVINRAWSLAQFWDGRAPTLEEQAKGPMANPIEMANTHDSVANTVKSIAGYRSRFRAAFGTEEISIDHVAKAIATFERTVVSGDSPFDRYKAGQRAALNAAQKRGMTVFLDKAKCDQCHEGINFTNGSFNNLGVGLDKPNPDEGLFAVTKRPDDWGKFKTPTLREVALTAPYMHDGSLATLEDVVEFYDRGGTPNKNKDQRMKPLQLSAQEKADMVEFLKALNGTGWQHIQAPKEFPQ